MEEGEEDDHEGPGPITSRRPWQPGTLMSKISRTVRGGEEVARNVRKGCRTLDEKKCSQKLSLRNYPEPLKSSLHSHACFFNTDLKIRL
jgi:hypothetical protein